MRTALKAGPVARSFMMLLGVRHGSRTKSTRATQADDACARHDCDLAPEADTDALCLSQPRVPRARARACEPRAGEETPSMSTVGEAEVDGLPESFDAVAARMELRLGRLAADIRQMRQELAEAEERSGRLRQRLANSEWLPGRAGGGLADRAS